MAWAHGGRLLFLLSLWGLTHGGLDNIINSFFGGGQQMQRGRGGRPRTSDARMELTVPLEDLYLGSTREISYNRNVVCKQCSGTGAEGGQTTRCRRCNGQGKIIENVQVMPGFTMQQQKTCPVCHGKGQQFKHQCPHCRGQGVHQETTSLTIDIEKGMKHGQEIRYSGKSEERPGHETGDLIAVIRQQEHRYFEREGDDLRTAVDVSLKQALLGFDLSIKHLDDSLVQLAHTGEITSHQQVRKYQNKGMPLYKRRRRFGDMFVEYRVQMPAKITSKDRLKLIELFPEMSLQGELGK